MTRVPQKLVDPPIVETICELRFQESTVAAHAAVVLYSEIRNEFPQIENLPHAQIPVELLLADRNLAFATTHRFVGDSVVVSAGPRTVNFTRGAPYPGWDVFRKEAMNVFEKALKVFGEKVERIGIKYTNFIEAPTGTDSLVMSKAKISLGDLDLANKPILVRTEIRPNPAQTAIVQLVAQAQLNGPAGQQVGLAMDVDSIAFGPFSGADEITAALERAHSYEKEVFFSLLSDDTIKKYKPTY